MFIIRDIFQLKFGHYKEAKNLLDEAQKKNMLPKAKHMRILADFTGDSYRLVLEQGQETLAEYEQSLSGNMATPEWQQWYGQFKEHIESSHREILKLVLEA